MFLKLLTVAYTALGGWVPSSTSLSRDVSHPPTGHHEKVFPDQRTFLLNVPEKYEHGVPHPLVLSFHGGELRVADHLNVDCGRASLASPRTARVLKDSRGEFVQARTDHAAVRPVAPAERPALLIGLPARREQHRLEHDSYLAGRAVR